MRRFGVWTPVAPRADKPSKPPPAPPFAAHAVKRRAAQPSFPEVPATSLPCQPRTPEVSELENAYSSLLGTFVVVLPFHLCRFGCRAASGPPMFFSIFICRFTNHQAPTVNRSRSQLLSRFEQVIMASFIF
jgi:hypothetical protein